MSNGLVYINFGRVIVDCPNECGNAFMVPMGATSLECGGEYGCNTVFTLDIPSNLSEIITELNKRPSNANRNWYPEGHPVAVKASIPMDQSVTDLVQEREWYEAEGVV